MILCITGMPGSGKTELAHMLGKKGFEVYEMSAPIMKYLKEHGIDSNEKNKGGYATQHRQETGQMDVFAREAIPALKKLKGKDLVIAGVRNNQELEFLKKNLKGLVTVALVAPIELRFERLYKRKRADDQTDYDLFVARDKREIGYGIDKAIDDADYLILNNTSNIEDLSEEVSELLGKLSK